MSGCPTREQLDLFLDERLPTDQQMWLGGHGGAWRACQKALEEVSARAGEARLHSLHSRHASPHDEPKAEVLMRIERAGWQRESRSDVIVGPTGAYLSPSESIPGMSAAGNSPD